MKHADEFFQSTLLKIGQFKSGFVQVPSPKLHVRAPLAQLGDEERLLAIAVGKSLYVLTGK